MEKRFLNSGGFMGYASDIYEMISSEDEIKDEQLFFTKLFLNDTTRVKAKFSLVEIFLFFRSINGRL
jgi:procollagen-lysine,2-oxoglutarate 5-dioxygenase